LPPKVEALFSPVIADNNFFFQKEKQLANLSFFGVQLLILPSLRMLS
jgi:hypothetical protein